MRYRVLASGSGTAGILLAITVAVTSLTAPTLGSVFGSRAASSGYGSYSAALSAWGGVWTKDALRSFLSDPESLAPGTTMANPGITDPEVLDAVVDLLEGVRTTVETEAAWTDLKAGLESGAP